jgi:hypothetical protein
MFLRACVGENEFRVLSKKKKRELLIANHVFGDVLVVLKVKNRQMIEQEIKEIKHASCNRVRTLILKCLQNESAAKLNAK